MSHKKCGPDRFSRSDVYWKQTNKQTDKQNLYIEVMGPNLIKWRPIAGSNPESQIQS